jgi:hypothetical protein
MAFTLPNPPIWQQNRKYSARLDRTFADVLFTEGVVDPGAGGYAVTQNALGLDNSVDVAAGVAVVEGDDENNQGKYVVRLEAPQNIPFGPAPTADARIDLLVLRVNDSTAGSTATPADVSRIEVIQGAVDPSPVAPVVPDTAIALAEVLRTSGDSVINNSMITDLRSSALLVLPAGVNSLGDIGDVDLAGLSDGDIIQYDLASGDWLAGPLPSAPGFNTVTASTSTAVGITTGTYTDSGLSATITPSSINSKILVCVIQPTSINHGGVLVFASYRLMRDSTEIARPTTNGGLGWGIEATNSGTTNMILFNILSLSFLDSPNTTSPVTYKTQGAIVTPPGTNLVFQPTTGSTAYMALIEIPG